MKQTIIFILGMLFYSNLQAQNKIDNYQIGNYFSYNKQIIDGYFDFDFEPIESFKISYAIGHDFTPGYYYNRSNAKIEGLIMYSQSNTYFIFKANATDKEKTIKPNECNAYVIGVDSFTVIENFDLQRELGAFRSTNREFAEVIDQVGDLTFYKHTRAGGSNIVVTYLVKANDATEYISIPKRKAKFKETAGKVFAAFEPLNKDIQSGKYKEEDFPTMIKILKYKTRFDQHQRIFFNASWDEVDNSNKSSYYANIESLQDSIFHIIYYFNNNIKIYEGDFTSFYPHHKRGDFSFYYPNGSIRKRVTYINNKPQTAIDFYENGRIHREYTITEDATTYKQVNDAQGNSLLNEAGNGTELFFDSITNREITYQYVSHELDNAFFIDSTGRKVFQLCQRRALLKSISSIQSKINRKIEYPSQSIKAYAHGYVLLKCIVEPTGLVSNLQVVKKVDSACDSTILQFTSSFTTSKKWKPAKVDGSKVAQELIIPIDFTIVGFSRYRNNYNNFWMQQNLMQQQMFMQQSMMMHQQMMRQTTAPAYHF